MSECDSNSHELLYISSSSEVSVVLQSSEDGDNDEDNLVKIEGNIVFSFNAISRFSSTKYAYEVSTLSSETSAALHNNSVR